MHTPGRPVSRPWVAAMNAADCSCRVSTSSMLEPRSDSTTSRFSSPGHPEDVLDALVLQRCHQQVGSFGHGSQSFLVGRYVAVSAKAFALTKALGPISDPAGIVAISFLLRSRDGHVGRLPPSFPGRTAQHRPQSASFRPPLFLPVCPTLPRVAAVPACPACVAASADASPGSAPCATRCDRTARKHAGHAPSGCD